MANVSLVKAVRMGKPILRVIWTIPQSDVTISQYQVRYRRNGTSSWGSVLSISGSPPKTSFILPGLDGGTEYNVIVRAVSDAKVEGNWSVEQTERTFDSKYIFIIYCYQLHLYLWRIVFIYYSSNCLFLCCAVATPLPSV